MKNPLREKDICNCDQALYYRETLETIQLVVEKFADVPGQTIHNIATIVAEALSEPSSY